MANKLKTIMGLAVIFVIIISLGSVYVYYKGVLSEKDRTIDDLKDENDQLDEQLDQLNDDYEDVLGEYGDLSDNYESMNTSYGELDQMYNALISDYHDLEWDYNDLLDDYGVLQSSYNNFDLWQDQVTYYRVYFGDMYFWQYATYDILSHWKSMDKDTSEYYMYPIEDMKVLNGFVVYNDNWSLVDQIADELWKLSENEEDYAEIALEFVHNAIFYMSDLESTGQDEYWRYPDETLFDKVGDCEDTAFLYASLLRSKGIPAVLIEYVDHLAVGVGLEGFIGTYYDFEGDRYFYAETTSNMFDEDKFRERNYNIGEIPPGLDNAYIHRAI